MPARQCSRHCFFTQNPKTLDDVPEFTPLLAIIPTEVYFLTPFVAVLLFLSALISGSEVAYFSLSPQQLDDCRKGDKPSEIRVMKLVSEPKLLLASILILNNLVNVAIVTISSYITWQFFGKDSQFTFWFLTVFITALIVFFGEVVPKVFAEQRNLWFAKFTSGVLYAANSFLRPFSWILSSLGNALEKRIKKEGYRVSVNELNQAVEMTSVSEVSDGEKEILRGIVNFGTKTVRQIMRSRIDITAIDLQTGFHVLMDKVNKSGYSRIPIYSETVDNIEGILYIKDLIPYIEKGEGFSWQNLIRRETFFVPENKKIDDLFRDFQEKRVHMAIVVDEYGGTSGLITMEDIIEEIVGEINDEFDVDELQYRKIDETAYTFDAKTSLNDLCKILSIPHDTFDTDKGDSESLGGLMLELFGKLPKAGERYENENFLFTIISANTKRVKNVRIRVKNPDWKNSGRGNIDLAKELE